MTIGFVVATLPSVARAELPEREAPKPTPPLATFTPAQGFHVKSADGDYMIRLGLALGIKYEPVWRAGKAQKNGNLAFVRPALSGHFFKPWLGYAVAMELAASTPFLLEASLSATPSEAVGLRIGQHVTPVSRHTSFRPAAIFFPDFASVPSYFWSGRQKGGTVYGSVIDGKLDYWVGLYGGSPLREQTSEPHNYVAEWRVTANPMGAINASEHPFTPDGKALPPRASFTVQGYRGRLQSTRENIDPTQSQLDPTQSLLVQRMTTGGADLWLQWGRFIAFGEYYRRVLTETTELPGFSAQGAWGQIVANVYANRIAVGGRFNWLDPSSRLTDDHVLVAEGQAAWYIVAPSLVLRARYAWQDQSAPDPATLGTFRLPFVPGTTHLVTLQVTLAL